LVEEGRLTQEGKGPAARYRLPRAAAEKQKETEARQVTPGEEKPEEAVVPLSTESEKIHNYLRQPSAARKAVGYDRQFLDSYRPNRSLYPSTKERAHLAAVGNTKAGVEATGHLREADSESAAYPRTRAALREIPIRCLIRAA
jgi:hypothetical protein